MCFVAMLMAVQKAYVCFGDCARERLRMLEGLPLRVGIPGEIGLRYV